MTKHSIFSPSASSRWLNCPASIHMEKAITWDTSNEYADEGTAAHKLLDRCLSENLNTDAFKGRYIYKDHKVDSEMAIHIQHVINTIRERAEGADAVYLEQSFSFSETIGQPDAFGTADVTIVRKGLLELHDLKYGFKYVDAKENTQLMLYAAGALETLKIKNIDRIYMAIHQPRIDNHSEWHTTTKELNVWIQKLKDSAADAVSENPTFNPTESNCKYCKAAGCCPALSKQIVNLVRKYND